MKVLGVIPARGGSKGIPRKNIRLMNGVPLIHYTIKAAQESILTDIIVSTEDEEIAEVSRRYGVPVVIRPAELAKDNTPTLPVLQHALDKSENDYDAVMTLQPTSPLRQSKHINEAIQYFSEEPIADSLVSVVKVPHNMTPVSIMEKQKKWITPYLKDKKLILRRQDKPSFWARNGAAIYITRINKLNEYIFGGHILGYEMNKIDSLDIDDMEDWKLVELILREFNGNADN